MRFNPQADNVRHGSSSLRPMASWTLWEAAGEGSRGLAVTPQEMAGLEGPFRNTSRRAFRRRDVAGQAPSPTLCAPEHEMA